MRRYDFIIILCGLAALVGVVSFNLFGQSHKNTFIFPPLSLLTQEQSENYASSEETTMSEIPNLPTVSPTSSVQSIVSLVPSKLRIAKLSINAVIESVGVTTEGSMVVPANAANVGWYKEGTVPSQKGNAVITGHYDTPSGRPAVFYRLYDLAIGDTIDVEYTDTTRKTFIVTGKDFIHLDIFPTQYVFNEKYGYNLNLITCGGVWDPKERNYQSRAVIYATLKGTQFDALGL